MHVHAHANKIHPQIFARTKNALSKIAIYTNTQSYTRTLAMI